MPPSQRWFPPWPISQTQAGNNRPRKGRGHVDKLHGILNGRKMGARIIPRIQDSLWVEAPQKEASEVSHLMKRAMEMARKPYLQVPLEVDFG